MGRGVGGVVSETSDLNGFIHSFIHSFIKLYFSTVKILAQRPTHISAVATILLISNELIGDIKI